MTDLTNAIRVVIITVSDSAFAKQRDDISGATIEQLLINSIKFTANIVHKCIIADEFELIRSTLLANVDIADVILTTGGTGFAPRDVTPEATKTVIDRDCPGIVIALLNRSLQSTPMAALSRLAAGIHKSTLIVNLPGSPKAVRECFEVLEGILMHAVDLIRDCKSNVQSTHIIVAAE